MPRSPVSSSSPGVSRNGSTGGTSRRTRCWSARPARTWRDLVVGEAGGARGGDRCARHELHAERRRTATQTTASARDGRGATRRGARPASRVRRSTDSGTTDEHGDARRTAGDDHGHDRAGRPTESLSSPTAGAEVAPVGHRVERPVERREEAHVEDLHDGQQAEQRRRRARATHPARAWAAGPARARRASSPSSGMRTNAPGVRSAELVRGDQGEPDEQRTARTVTPRRPTAGAATPVAAARRSTRTADASARCSAGPGRCRHSHHTSRPNDSASRASATTSATSVDRRRQDVGRRDRQHDALDAATTLRQYRGGSGPRSHGSSQPAATNA